jgi:hypothetical protein
MKMTFMLLALALLACLSTSSIIDKYMQFKRYATEYNKKYSSTITELYRFNLYLQNLVDI